MTNKRISRYPTDAEKFDDYLREYNISFIDVLTMIIRNSFIAKLYRRIMVPASNKGYLPGIQETEKVIDYDRDIEDIVEVDNIPEYRVIDSLEHMAFTYKSLSNGGEWWETTINGKKLSIIRIRGDKVIVKYNGFEYYTPLTKVNDLLFIFGSIKNNGKLYKDILLTIGMLSLPFLFLVIVTMII